jgi:alpha-amylase
VRRTAERVARRIVAAAVLAALLSLPAAAAQHIDIRGSLPLQADPKVRLWQDERIYFIMVDRFRNGDPSNDGDARPGNVRTWNGGDLQGVIEKLDYIRDLGFTAIWLTPIVENTGADYHGYGAVDFFSVDPHFGTLETARQLVREAHRRQIKVIFDLVINHTGKYHPLAQEQRDWFNPRKECTDWNDQKHIEECWIFALPDFDQNHPQARDYILKYSLFWIEQTGVDGYRIDTAKHVPIDFYPWYTAEIKRRYPNFWFLGEVWSASADYVAPYQDAGLDAITDFAFYEAAVRVYARYGHARALKTAAEGSLRTLRDPLNMGGFIDNHDVPRFTTEARGETERLRLALVHLFTHLSIPIVYYGTEVGLEGGSDPFNRPLFPWETYEQQNPDVRRLVKTLNRVRHERIALRRGGWEELHTAQTVHAFARYAGSDKVIVVLNNDETERFTASLPLKGEAVLPDGTHLFDELSGRRVRVQGGAVAVDLAPKTAAVFVLQPTRAGIYFVIAAAVTVLLIGGTLLLGRRSS